MRQLFLIILTLATMSNLAQKLDITTVDKTKINTTLLDSAAKANLLAQFNGKQDNSLRKKWTARTFQLSDGRIILEFYDKQALLIDNVEDFKKLDQVRFVKNTIDFLKKNISYKIELSFEKAKQIVETEKPKRLPQFKSESDWSEMEVYELNTHQVLFLYKWDSSWSGTIYADLKTLAAEHTTIQEQLYGSQDDEHLMKKLAAGDRLADYEGYDHMIYPKYLTSLVKNHKLKLIQRKVYVTEFFGNLYKSDNGYYMLVDEVKQKNGAGNKMRILSLRTYDSIEQVRQAESTYQKYKDVGGRSEHFYQKISDTYGQKFPELVTRLVDSLPSLLNFDKEQLAFDSTEMDIVDEALKWNGTNYRLFDTWFPSVLAYYGQCYAKAKQDGQWTTTYDEEYKIWIPEMKLSDGTMAWDLRDFYKGLYEGPIPMRWAGDWDGRTKKFRSSLKKEQEH